MTRRINQRAGAEAIAMLDSQNRTAAKKPCAAHSKLDGGTVAEYQSWCSACRAANATLSGGDEIVTGHPDPESTVDGPTCGDCWHPAHPFSTCHEHTGGDPSNGPNYCPCTAEMEAMEAEIRRLRAAVPAAVEAETRFLRAGRTYVDGKVTLDADIFDDVWELLAARAHTGSEREAGLAAEAESPHCARCGHEEVWHRDGRYDCRRFVRARGRR